MAYDFKDNAVASPNAIDPLELQRIQQEQRLAAMIQERAEQVTQQRTVRQSIMDEIVRQEKQLANTRKFLELPTVILDMKREELITLLSLR